MINLKNIFMNFIIPKNQPFTMKFPHEVPPSIKLMS